VDTKAIINEVARRHKIRLSEDDPILATITAIEVVHQIFAEHLKTLVTDVANQATDRLVAQIETGRREVASQIDLSKATAAKLVNDAGTWSADKLMEASSTMASDFLSAVAASSASVQADIIEVRRARLIAIWAAGFTTIVSAISLGGGIGFWLAGR
jgi:hypothetical protein